MANLDASREMGAERTVFDLSEVFIGVIRAKIMYI